MKFIPARSSDADRGVHGFTLVEALVALTIFAGMAIVLAGAYLNVLNSYAIAGRANQTNEDVTFARAQLLAEPDRKVIEEGGDFESADSRRVKWTATIASTAINDLFTVTFVCEINDPTKSEPEKATQTFTVLRPTWSDPAERTQLLEEVKNRITKLQEKKR
jgi:general secretion pathway protein I